MKIVLIQDHDGAGAIASLANHMRGVVMDRFEFDQLAPLIERNIVKLQPATFFDGLTTNDWVRIQEWNMMYSDAYVVYIRLIQS